MNYVGQVWHTLLFIPFLLNTSIVCRGKDDASLSTAFLFHVSVEVCGVYVVNKTNSEHIDGSCPAVFVLLRCTEDCSPEGPQGKHLFLALCRLLLYVLVTLFPQIPRNQHRFRAETTTPLAVQLASDDIINIMLLHLWQEVLLWLVPYRDQFWISGNIFYIFL